MTSKRHENADYIYITVTMLKQRQKELKESYSQKPLSIKSLRISHAGARNFAQVNVIWGLKRKSSLCEVSKRSKVMPNVFGSKAMI